MNLRIGASFVERLDRQHDRWSADTQLRCPPTFSADQYASRLTKRECNSTTLWNVGEMPTCQSLWRPGLKVCGCRISESLHATSSGWAMQPPVTHTDIGDRTERHKNRRLMNKMGAECRQRNVQKQLFSSSVCLETC